MGDGILTGAAKVIESIDNLSDGWFLVHKSKREAKADATYPQLYIEQMRESGIELSDSEAKAFMLMNAKTIRSAENLSAILDDVTIAEDAPTDEIQDEWYSAWVDGAKDAFSDWNRAIYKKALECKASDPTSLSRAALGVIAKLDESDIDTIEKLMGITPDGDRVLRVPMIVSDDDEVLGIIGLSMAKIGHMCDVGVLRQAAERQESRVVISPDYLKYAGYENSIVSVGQEGFDLMVELEFPEVGKVKVPSVRISSGFISKNSSGCFVIYGNYVLTEAGKEICGLLEPCSMVKVSEYLIEGCDRLARIENRNAANMMSNRDFDRKVAESVRRATR